MFKRIVSSASTAAILVLAPVTACVALPAVAAAQDTPAKQRPAVKKAKGPKKTAKARKTPKKNTKAKTGKAKVAKAEKLNIKRSIARTDGLLAVAQRAVKAKNVQRPSLVEAEKHQRAALKAVKAKDEGAAVHLTLEARRLARQVIVANGKTVPKKHVNDAKIETSSARPEAATAFLAPTTRIAPVSEDAPDDDMIEDGLDDGGEDDSF